MRSRSAPLLVLFLFAILSLANSNTVAAQQAQDVTAQPAGNLAQQPYAVGDPGPAARTAVNSLFFELAGNGASLYSINYERFFDKWGLRGGISFLPSGTVDTTWSFSTATIVGSYHLGDGAHKLQVGLGVTASYASRARPPGSYGGTEARGGIAATAVVGYRYLPADGGFDFGVGWTPIVGFQPGVLGVFFNNTFANVIGLLGIGLHFGYAF